MKYFYLMLLFMGMQIKLHAQGQASTFFKLYDFKGGNNYFDDVQEVENRFYAAGLSMLPNTGRRRAYLVGVDNKGIKFLEKEFVIDSPLVIETGIIGLYVSPQKEIYLTGSNSYLDSNTVFGYARYPLLVKLDSLGNVLWHKVFYESLYPSMLLYKIFPLANNKFMAIGSQQLQDGTDRVTMLFYLLDSAGNVLSKNFPSPLTGAGMFSRGRSQLKDKSVLIYGTTYYRDINRYARSAIRIDTNLNIVWAKEYGPLAWDQAFSYGHIAEEDSTAIIPGFLTNSTIFDEYEGVLERINILDGKSIRYKSFKLGESTFFDGVAMAGDGLMVAGADFDLDFDGSDASFWRLDSNWNVLWQNEYFNPYFPGLNTPNENTFAFITTSDGGFLSAGFTRDTLNGNGLTTQDAMLIKVDSNGCLVAGCNVVGINTDPEWKSEIRIYPNPATELLHIENAQQQTLLRVYSMQGTLVYARELLAEKDEIQLSEFSPGVYVLDFENQQGVRQQERLVVSR